jgi:anti-anti-sigma factor
MSSEAAMLHFRSRTLEDFILVEFIVPGIHDGPEIDHISEELHELIGRSSSKKMIIDLNRVRFVASRALSLLVSLKRTVEVHKGTLLICGVREQVLQIFRIAGQDRFLSLHPNRDAILAAMNMAVSA